MDIDEALNDPGLKAARAKDNEFILPVALPACFHNPLRERSAGNAEVDGGIDVLPTTMIGTRPTVTLTFSPRKREQEEAEYVAGLGFWAKLYYRGFLRQQAD